METDPCLIHHLHSGKTLIQTPSFKGETERPDIRYRASLEENLGMKAQLWGGRGEGS